MYLCIGTVGTVKKKKEGEWSETREDPNKKNAEDSATEAAEQFDLQGLLLSRFHYSGHFNKYYKILLQKL